MYLARNVCEKTLNAQGFPIMDSSEKLEAVTVTFVFHDISFKNMRHRQAISRRWQRLCKSNQSEMDIHPVSDLCGKGLVTEKVSKVRTIYHNRLSHLYIFLSHLYHMMLPLDS